MQDIFSSSEGSNNIGIYSTETDQLSIGHTTFKLPNFQTFI